MQHYAAVSRYEGNVVPEVMRWNRGYWRNFTYFQGAWRGDIGLRRKTPATFVVFRTSLLHDQTVSGCGLLQGKGQKLEYLRRWGVEKLTLPQTEVFIAAYKENEREQISYSNICPAADGIHTKMRCTFWTVNKYLVDQLNEELQIQKNIKWPTYKSH